MKTDASSFMSSALPSSLPSADVYTDINSLQNIKNTENKDEALKKVAQQFESIFVNQMLKSMREANAVFEEDSLFNSQESNFYRDMHDQQLALTLSHGRGMGIADALYRQLSSQQHGEAAPIDRNIQAYKPIAAAAPVAPEPVKASVSNQTSASSPEEFIQSLLPKVKAAAKALGIDPEVLVAQAALETGWGKKVIADNTGKPSNNLFNIKANNWSGGSVSAATLEFSNGKVAKETAAFRQYDSVEESVKDYVAFIKNNPRYSDFAHGVKSAEEYIHGIANAGYATDPSYADKVLSVLERVVEKAKALSASTASNSDSNSHSISGTGNG